MDDEASPRQLLYAMVAGGFHLVVGVLAVGSAAIAPTWWNAVVAIAWIAIAAVLVIGWRRTGTALGVSLLGFVGWTVGAAILLT